MSDTMTEQTRTDLDQRARELTDLRDMITHLKNVLNSFNTRIEALEAVIPVIAAKPLTEAQKQWLNRSQ